MERTVSKSEEVLQVRGLRTLFPVSRGVVGALLRRPRRVVHAVDDVSFTMVRGEILGLVGESGSGKTTTALNTLGLLDATEGEILFQGQSIPEMAHGRDRLRLRQQMQVIFQDPYEALNPRHTVFQAVAEPLDVHHLIEDKNERVERVGEALETAGLKPPESFFDRYPRELSGGQRQRLVIAGALVLNPDVLVADEPVSMLDVSIRAEILNLLRELRDERGITILYITHDLATAAFFTDRIAVMYLGRIVEIGPTKTVLTNPRHPYTKALLSVVPVPNPRLRRKRLVLASETPDPIDLPSGCRFHPRCPIASDECRQIDPQLEPVGLDHESACLKSSEVGVLDRDRAHQQTKEVPPR